MKSKSAAFMLLAVLVLLASARPSTAVARPSISKPNVILIQVDDLSMSVRSAKLRQGSKLVPAMPLLNRLMVSKGVSFSRFYTNNPICGPSRASLLSGLATHNHGMLINAAPFGYESWINSPSHSENLATWLDRAGYRTAHVGKFLNGYGPDSAVPPGWDSWVTTANNSGAPYYGYRLNVNGRLTEPVGSWSRIDPAGCVPRLPVSHRKACNHSTDVFTAYAKREIRRSSRTKDPLFLSLDFNAPHDDGRSKAGPQSRYRSDTSRVEVKLPRDDFQGGESKPFFMRDLEPISKQLRNQVQTRFRNEVASMRGVDEAIGSLVGELRKSNQLRNTYVMFFSDNGIFHGQHRVAYGKFLPHEPATRQPLIIRGPGLASGVRSNALASMIDLAPTITDLAGAQSGPNVDGKSLKPYATDPRKTAASPVQLEGFNGRALDFPGPFTDGMGKNRPNQALVVNYSGFVAGRWKFVRYYFGDEELYDLSTDPSERFNLARREDFNSVLDWARAVTSLIDDCVGTECQIDVQPPTRPS